MTRGPTKHGTSLNIKPHDCMLTRSWKFRRGNGKDRKKVNPINNMLPKEAFIWIIPSKFLLVFQAQVPFLPNIDKHG
jgi:hypothetical protein